MTEGAQPTGIGGHSVVREVPLQYPPKLRALFRNRVMPVTMQLLLEFAQRGLHPIATRHALKRERAVPRVRPQMCVNPRKLNVSGLLSPRSARRCVACRPNSIRRVFCAMHS